MKKTCWIDLETSGLNPKACAIIQLALLIEVNGELVDKLVLKLCPNPDQVIEDKALEVSCTTREDLSTYESQRQGYNKLIGLLDRYVDKYDRSDKLIFAAFNAGFDDDFLRSFFLMHGNKYYGSYFFWSKLDIQTFVALVVRNGLRLPNYRLATMCEHYGIDIVAHDALADITATRELFLKLKGELCS